MITNELTTGCLSIIMPIRYFISGRILFLRGITPLSLCFYQIKLSQLVYIHHIINFSYVFFLIMETKRNSRRASSKPRWYFLLEFREFKNLPAKIWYTILVFWKWINYYCIKSRYQRVQGTFMYNKAASQIFSTNFRFKIASQVL